MWRLLFSAVLSLPAALLQIVVTPMLALLWLPAVFLVRHQSASVENDTDTESTTCQNNRHAVITGGSSGIGLAIAKECASKKTNDNQPFFTHVTILARNQERLDAAQAELEKLNADKINIRALSVDVSDPAALQAAAQQVYNVPKDSDTTPSIPTFLFCCAGAARPGYFCDISPSDFLHACRTNQLGVLYTVHAFVPYLTNTTSTIQLCSSMAGQLGVFGLTAYAPTKFALRGLAESLHMELCVDTPLAVQVAYPPDTDTPGFATENERKPAETAAISGTTSLLHPSDVAKTMVQAATGPNRPFAVYFDVDGWMLSTLTAGFAPLPASGFYNLLRDGLVQVTLMPLFRMVALLYLQYFYHLVRTCRREEKAEAPVKETTTAEADASVTSAE